MLAGVSEQNRVFWWRRRDSRIGLVMSETRKVVETERFRPAKAARIAITSDPAPPHSQPPSLNTNKQKRTHSIHDTHPYPSLPPSAKPTTRFQYHNRAATPVAPVPDRKAKKSGGERHTDHKES
ncbi:uncharacterized protein K452DRAFT_137768 [Aplosporella prunicola CBS 121167]|uniref:Uncharacterized protein n=1 Tax=Aplosporella prunicola CBS 121167 TaxID=1176127 RepID=A0A6A6AYU8_9PEZI|nr:uncharacterized protein K452DRAFT_137768 [Aplosporella prunicola CBS 121167]KAF2136363.1 hypothetical protein K452DRAFT_137768 [Aplosporella prunicola CBS 121167]